MHKALVLGTWTQHYFYKMHKKTYKMKKKCQHLKTRHTITIILILLKLLKKLGNTIKQKHPVIE